MAISIGTVSYAAAAMAFLFLSALLVTTWRGRLQGILLAMNRLLERLDADIALAMIPKSAGDSRCIRMSMPVRPRMRSRSWNRSIQPAPRIILLSAGSIDGLRIGQLQPTHVRARRASIFPYG